MSDDKCPCGENHTRRQHRAAVTTGEVEDMRAEIERLREALEFYADVLSWRPSSTDRHVSAQTSYDVGDKARAALKKEAQGE